MLTFLLLRWTGMRGSDVVGLRWGEIEWETREINRLTQKRRKRVLLPDSPGIALRSGYRAGTPAARSRGPCAAESGDGTASHAAAPLRANARQWDAGRECSMHTHTATAILIAVDLLARGASPYDVAKLLGDTVETIEKHYAPFVRELRERARRIMEIRRGG